MRHNCDALDLIMSALLYDLFKTAHTSFSEFFRILSSRKCHGPPTVNPCLIARISIQLCIILSFKFSKIHFTPWINFDLWNLRK